MELTGWNLVASELMEVEALRTLYRVHLERLLTDDDLGARMAELREIVAALDQFPITRQVLRRAGGPFPGILKTLDAIHLATALLWSEHFGENIAMITHDRQLARVARASGLEVHPWPMT
jgi:predicted nucleic acid-binding protein